MSEHLQKETRDDAVLSLRNVTMRFGGVTALNAVNIDLYPGEILALIGPNGAGKTTVFNVVTGVYQATEGDIVFNGERLNGLKRYEITKKGIARTFQNIRLWGDMTALENVITGTDVHKKSGVIGALFGLPRARREEKAGREKAMEILKFIGIDEYAARLARHLPYGGARSQNLSQRQHDGRRERRAHDRSGRDDRAERRDGFDAAALPLAGAAMRPELVGFRREAHRHAVHAVAQPGRARPVENAAPDGRRNPPRRGP